MLADGIDSHIISISFETDSLPYPGRGKDNDAKIGDFSSNFIAAPDAHTHLKAVSLKLLPWQLEVKKSHFCF